MLEKAIKILQILEEKGYEAYIIGGYPRDFLLGIKNDDIDITTSMPPNIVKSLFEIEKDNSEYGSLIIKYEDYFFEITTYRIETEYSGRYPKVVYTDNLKEDILRRDFTINTICMDKNQKIIDLMNGRSDIDNKIVRCIGNIGKKLNEDPIRILRAIRFASKLNFKLEENLEKYIIENGNLLKKLSINKTKQELDKMNEKGLDLLNKLDLNKYIRR